MNDKPTGLVKIEKCKTCDGQGRVNRNPPNMDINWDTCPDCNAGFIRTDLTADEAVEVFKSIITEWGGELNDGSRIELKEKP